MLYIFFAYLKRHLKIALLFTLYTLIFSVIFYLHHLPIDAVGYAFLLSLFFTVIFLGYGFTKYYQQHRHLEALSHSITLSLSTLPDTKDLIIKDYQALMRLLYEALHRFETESDYSRMAMIDYYTLWAHQIKTPIAALYLILESEPGERNLSMKTELFKIEQYVDMVLQFLRLESETSDLRIETHDLATLIKSSIRKYRTLFIEKQIRLNFDEMSYAVLTDEKWFCFAFEQILSNAIKYTYEGTITIGLSQENPHILTVCDTGIGIQEEDLPRVFERGFTGYNGRMDKKSTGIGLYLCKRAFQKISHRIHIDSTVGVGTTVSIDLSRNDISNES